MQIIKKLSLAACLFTLFYLSAFNVFASIDGQYRMVDDDSPLTLILSNGTYRIYVQEGEHGLDMQIGKFQIKGKRIYFYPQVNDIPDLGDSSGVILSPCRIEWEGDIFVKNGCDSSKEKETSSANIETIKQNYGSNHKKFPHHWTVFENQILQLSVPVGAKVETEDNEVRISYADASGELMVVNDANGQTKKLLNSCMPIKSLAKENTKFFICSDKANFRFMQIVSQGRPAKMLSYVKANDLSTLKALSIALSSIKLKTKDSSQKAGTLNVTMEPWQPRDGSFTISVPRGWNVDGGTADFGRNGYVRIVQAVSPDQKKMFIGLYYPFYQYVQLGGMARGIPPMGPEEFMNGRFFADLAQHYQITFNNLRINSVKPDNQLSEQLNREAKKMIERMNVRGSAKYEAFTAEALFDMNGQKRPMYIFGIMTYTTLPLSGGYSYLWGPSPIIMAVTPEGSFKRWCGVFEKMAESWQVNPRWLSAHMHYAASDAKATLNQFKKISALIRKQGEELNNSLNDWEKQTDFEMELFYDTFHVLGGEDRYDNPVTGEEIDVPTGADKYLYDQYSQAWIGIKMDKPDAPELVQELKENGFIELTPHTY